MIVNSGAMRSMGSAELAAFDAGDRELAEFWQAVKALLDAAGMPDRELRLTTGNDLRGPRLRLTVGPASKVGEADPELELVANGSTADELLRALESGLAAMREPEPTAGADSPLTAPTGERLLDEAGYSAIRAAVLNLCRALGSFDAEVLEALIATAKRSIGPGLEQAVAEGTIPVDRLGQARDALELELELFEAAAVFRRRIGRVQDRVRAHVATEEANAGAPPAIEVIRHNAGRNGGGT